MTTITMEGPMFRINTSSISASIANIFVTFAEHLEKKFNVQVTGECWKPIDKHCGATLQSGPNKNTPCQKPKMAGSDRCSMHSKKATVQTVTPSVIDVAGIPCFRANKWGNISYNGLILDKNAKKIIGRQEEDGKIGKLTSKDLILIKTFKFEYDPSAVDTAQPSVQPSSDQKSGEPLMSLPDIDMDLQEEIPEEVHEDSEEVPENLHEEQIRDDLDDDSVEIPVDDSVEIPADE